MEVSPETRETLNALAGKAVRMAAEFITLDSFTPFGLTVDTDESTSVLNVDFMPKENRIELLRQSLEKSAKEKNIQSVALVFDAIAVHPDQDEKSDAIAIEMEHRDGVSITSLFHYTIDNGEPATISPYGIPRDPTYFV